MPPIGIMMSVTTYLVLRDSLEGKLTQDPAIAGSAKAASGDMHMQGSTSCPTGLGWWRRLQLAIMVQCDYFGGALITMFAYGFFPCCMAAWSLLFRADFLYVVGTKPTEAAKGSVS